MTEMTPRERMMTACRNQQPDRIPAAPDISNMVPCRLTGKPFWDIYVKQDPPLWRAYVEAVKRFGMDGWFTYGDLQFKLKSHIEIDEKIVRRDAGRWEVRRTCHTPDGDLMELMVSPVDNPPTLIEKLVKDFEKDFSKYRHLYSGVTGYDGSIFAQQKKELGELGMMCVWISPPGLQCYVDHFNGSLEAVTYAYYDYPELFEELAELHDRQAVQMTEMAIDAGVDSILTGGSGSITLQSPEIWRKLSLPTLKKITKMCREAGVISGIHSCGKEMYLIEACAAETHLDYVNPLEMTPMGDCDLAECKRKVGSRLALMGNLHTTNVMLYGSPGDVKLESLKSILAAGENGGFVLSTGDQCGRDTPDENIFSMVQTVKEFGQYPLDYDRINEEIKQLERE